MRTIVQVAAVGRGFALLTLLAVASPTATMAQVVTTDTAQTKSTKAKTQAPQVAFSIGVLTAPIDSKSSQSWNTLQFSYIPRRWPRWEVALASSTANERIGAVTDSVGNYYYPFMNVGGTTLQVAHRWAPMQVLRLAVRGGAGVLVSEYSTCRRARNAPSVGCVMTPKTKDQFGIGSIESLAELKVWRWIHAEFNVGYRQTGRPSAPPPVTGSAMSGFTYGWAIRLGKFP